MNRTSLHQPQSQINSVCVWHFKVEKGTVFVWKHYPDVQFSQRWYYNLTFLYCNAKYTTLLEILGSFQKYIFLIGRGYITCSPIMVTIMVTKAEGILHAIPLW